MSVELVQCPYCEVEWIDSAKDLVCSKCERKATLDLFVVDASNAIKNILSMSDLVTDKRRDVLIELRNELDAAINKHNGR